MNRYLVSKGLEGFCDRLQCFSHSINMSLRFNRILFVDWGDNIWSHDTSNFYRYFDLVDLPYVTSADQIPGDLEVYPSFWRRGVGLLNDQWVYKLKDELLFNPLEGKHFEAVWVHPGVGFRAYDFDQLIKHLRLTSEVAAEVQTLLAKAPTDLPVVHLRGTDRAVSEERWSALRQAAPLACVISDDAVLTRRWLNESPDSIILSDTLVEGSVAGHKLDADSLGRSGMTKHGMNIRLLTDFVLLARAKEAFPLNDQSIFFEMARIFGLCGGVPELFKAAPPAVTLPTCRSGYTFQYRSS